MYTMMVPEAPCDVILVADRGRLYGLTVIDDTATGVYLGETASKDCAIMCKAHSFHRSCVSVNFDDGMGLVDGVGCFDVNLAESGRRLIDEVSCS